MALYDLARQQAAPLPPADLTDRPPIDQSVVGDSAPSGRPSYDPAFDAAGKEYGIDPDILRGVAYAESRFRPDIVSGKVTSRKGAIGLMQHLPATAQELGINPKDPVESIFGGAAYLRQALDKHDGDLEKAIASYNWGPNRKVYGRDDWKDHAPDDTQTYIDTVLGFAQGLADKRGAGTQVPLPQGVAPNEAAGAGRGNAQAQLQAEQQRIRDNAPKPYEPGAVMNWLGEGVGAVEPPAPAKTNGSIAGNIDFGPQTVDPAKNLAAMQNSGSPDSVMFTPAHSILQANKGEQIEKSAAAAEAAKTPVGVLESAGRGLGESASVLSTIPGLIAAPAAVAFDRLVGGTNLQDAVFRQLVDPGTSAKAWYAIKPTEKQTFLAGLAGALGSTVADLPLMIASGGLSAEMKAAESVPTISRFMEQVTGQGFEAMRPIMVKAGMEKARQVLDNGGDVRQAMTSGWTAALSTGFMGSQPMSATGRLAERVATGIPVGAISAEAQRNVQNAADPANMQTPFSVEGMAQGALSNTVLASVMGGHGHPSGPAPDRIAMGYDPLTGKTPTARALADAYGSINDQQGLGPGQAQLARAPRVEDQPTTPVVPEIQAGDLATKQPVRDVDVSDQLRATRQPPAPPPPPPAPPREPTDVSPPVAVEPTVPGGAPAGSADAAGGDSARGNLADDAAAAGHAGAPPARAGGAPNDAAPDAGGAPGPVAGPRGIVHELALKAQSEAGWDHKWPFIPADLLNADFRRLIENDPGLTPEEKQRIFEAGAKLGVVPKEELVAQEAADVIHKAASGEPVSDKAAGSEPASPKKPEPLQQEPVAGEQLPMFKRGENDTPLPEGKERPGDELSTRVPTTKVDPQDHMGKLLTADMDTMRTEPDKLAQNADLISQYPGVPTRARLPASRIEAYIEHLKNNLLWLHDQVPDAIRQRSKKWYDGARKIAEGSAKEHDISEPQAAGVYAVLSPQKDWFMNVSLGRRVMSIVRGKQDHQWDEAMEKAAGRIFAKDKYAPGLDSIRGKTLSEVTDPIEKAMWVRAYDEAHNTRSHQIISPEGATMSTRMTAKGQPHKVAWGSLSEIAKAISIMENGSPENISKMLGTKHKVRNFYNNIVAPNSENGHTTIDTHAVAAGNLRPLSGKSPEVAHNFGSGVKGESGPAASARSGIKGTYPIYHEAYKRAAAARGLLPRELQSITWEAIRGLFKDTFKSNKGNIDAVDAIWNDYKAGKIDLASARQQILDRAGGIEKPEWLGGPLAGLHDEAQHSADEEELPGAELPRRGAKSAVSGARSGDSARAEVGDAAFARGDEPTRVEQGKQEGIQRFVEGVTSDWANAPKVVVARDMNDPRIPQPVRDYNQQQIAQGAAPVVHGFVYGGKVFLVAKHLNSREQALTTLAHEALGHYGFKGLFGTRLEGIKSQIVLTRRADIIKKMRDYGLVPKDVALKGTDAEVWAASKPEDRLYAAEEVLAEMAQKTPSANIVQRAVGAIRAWLRSKGLGLKMTDNDIITQFIIPARNWVENGKAGSEGLSSLSNPEFHRAFHGSPHDFDQFSTDKIGTGEGAQAYGHGLYFAENPGVADGYRKALTGDVLRDGKPVNKMTTGPLNLFMVDMFKNRKLAGLSDEKASEQTAEWAKQHSQIKTLGNAKIDEFVNSLSSNSGKLYQVDIPDHVVGRMLHWDKPLSEQPENVKEALAGLGFKVADPARAAEIEAELPALNRAIDRGGEEANAAARRKNALLEELDNVNPEGRHIYRDLSERMAKPTDDMASDDGAPRGWGAVTNTVNDRVTNDKAASAHLDSLGIPGIKYLDGGSRFTDGEGTHNLVVFNDKNVTLTHKDGTPVSRAEKAEYLAQEKPQFSRDGDNPGDGTNKEPRDATQESESAAAASARGLPDAGGVRGSDGVLAQPRGQAPGNEGREFDGSLRGLPRRVGDFVASAFHTATEVAERYMASRGEKYSPPDTYVKVDPQRAKRIADAYEAMKHDPQNPEVKAAYKAMIDETLAQYEAIMKTGLKVEFIDFDKTGDPYEGNPRAMTDDVRNNNHMWVFSTKGGFGSNATFDPAENPLLAETPHQISGQTALANDIFRVVHDYFGHVKEGVGFRADGEENAWRAHSAMYSDLARRAMTSETRGQNSWVNFGPHGEKNRTASSADTVYADQKTGLLPEWVSNEGRGDDVPRETVPKAGEEKPAFSRGGDATADGADHEEAPEPPRPYNGPGRKFLGESRNLVDSVLGDVLMKVSPMSVGTHGARAIVKDFANAKRLADYQWQRFDSILKNNYTESERAAMWEAGDDENLQRMREAEDPDYVRPDGSGLDALPPGPRKTMETLHEYGEELMRRAQQVGLFKGEGVPFWTPRMAAMIGENGEYTTIPGKGAQGVTRIATDGRGRNINTSASSLKQRKYLTSQETEAAADALAKSRGGQGAELVKDIRTMPMAMARMERAIASRELINRIKEYGEDVGIPTVSDSLREGFYTEGNNPAFYTWGPHMITDADGKRVPAIDQNGEITMVSKPIFISKDFEGPLKSIMTEKSGPVYTGAMALKAKSTGLIMYSPLIHNAVEWGRVMPMMPGKVITFRVYFDGNKVKNDPVQMADAIKHGMTPLGHRGQMQDITGLMEDPSLTPGRSLTAKLIGGAIGAVNDKAGLAVKKGIDKAGDVWHNTLLWDRIADLQAGIYAHAKTVFTRTLQEKWGLAPDVAEGVASYLGAHMANRYAGALANEAMSSLARKIANVLLFSRSFTLGNLGVMKDMFTGFPPDVAAQIERDFGSLALRAGKSVAKRKAIGAFAMDIALMYAGNTVLQGVFDWLKRGKSSGTLDTIKDAITPWQWQNLPADLRDKIGRGQLEDEYIDRVHRLVNKFGEHPIEVASSPYQTLGGLTANADNEPGKEDRIRYGKQDDGTNIYMRLPTGKIGEEFKNWQTKPFTTLMAKEGTISRPLLEIFNNDKGLGQRVYNPDDKSWEGIAKAVGNSVVHFMGAQVPVDSIKGAHEWIKGTATDVDKMKVWGPLVGLTFSKGAPGGPAVGEMYHEMKVHEGLVQDAMPDIRQAIKDGDEDKARELMEKLAMTAGQIRSIIKHQEDPESRLSPAALKKYEKIATPESQERMERFRSE